MGWWGGFFAHSLPCCARQAPIHLSSVRRSDKNARYAFIVEWCGLPDAMQNTQMEL